MVGFFLDPWSLAGWSSSSPPSASLSALPSGIKQQPISIHGGLFKVASMIPVFLVNSWLIFWDCFFFQRMAEKCSQFACILGRGSRKFKEAIREQVGTIFASTNGLDDVESFQNVYQYWYYHTLWRNRNFKPCLPLNYAWFPWRDSLWLNFLFTVGSWIQASVS